MPIDILLTVVATAIIQSLFGVGVLLFGTPLLLLMDYSFLNALMILLPISIAINLLQIIKHHELIDLPFVKNILRYTIPLVVLFLFFVTTGKVNIGLFVGVFLILVALKDVFPSINRLVDLVVVYERIALAVMGIIHGLTNLGGSMLTAIVHGKHYEKDQTIAVCYALFAIFQLLTLIWLRTGNAVSYSDNVSLLQIGVVVFLLTEEMVYRQIDNRKYSKLFAVFLLVSGLLLLAKSF